MDSQVVTVITVCVCMSVCDLITHTLYWKEESESYQKSSDFDAFSGATTVYVFKESIRIAYTSRT